MSYHNLSDSGMSSDAMRQEATRIVNMFPASVPGMQEHEAKFIADMRKPYRFVNTKQIFWLRDLKDKYL